MKTILMIGAKNIIKTMFILVLYVSAGKALAVTSGPTQPEVQQFTPIGASDMVDLFSGNFMYNIPLFELPGPNGGYPFNIGYRSGITMDQESSWIGLGWNLHVGSINRQMRTLPDEFNGTEQIIKMNDLLDNKTISVGLNYNVEIGGKDGEDVPKLAPSYGVTMYYNTYKGFGFASDIGVGASFSIQDGLTGGIGLSVTNDNQEGATFSPNLSLGFTDGEGKASTSGSINLGMNYNSNMGLENISLGGGMSLSTKRSDRDAALQAKRSNEKEKAGATSFGISNTASMSFNNAFITSPSIKNPTKTSIFQGFFKLGGFTSATQMSGAVHGSYSNEVLINKMKPVSYPAYGYFNLQKGKDDKRSTLDFIREKDGILHKDIRNLAAPVLTYDIYSVSGHGFSGMFRPYRSDIGAVYDHEVLSYSDGLNLSLDASIGNIFQAGFSINQPNTNSQSGQWKGASGNIHERYHFTESSENSLHEPYRFQVYGEKNALDKNEVAHVFGELTPSYVNIDGVANHSSIDYTTTQYLYDKNQSLKRVETNHLDKRIPRQTDIKAIENRYLYDPSLLPECVAYFVDTLGQIDTLNRSKHLEHHIGAFIVTTPDGTRYIYGLPVYNKKQVECSFSTYFGNEKNSLNKDLYDKIPDEYFHHNGKFVEHNSTEQKNYGYENFERTEIPAYVHTWLLTAIIGPDYVDLNQDGITDDDLGYFVRFTYKKANDYQWRAPFTSANFIEGQHALGADNMGTYNYGERETYYLYKAETKSHQAEFYTSKKEDGRGVSTEFQKSNSAKGSYSYKLDSIKLFSKLEMSKPVKSMYFKYNKYGLGDTARFWVDAQDTLPELCREVENAPTGRGKLTLKALYTTFGDNEKGLNHPYIFNYHEGNILENPNYHPFEYDRWGNYQQHWTDASMNPLKYFPYTRQDQREGHTKEKKDQWASVWSLKEIMLPSGARIVVDYEADRYAYVQNKPAMEMYPIKGINDLTPQVKYKVAIGEHKDHENYVTFELKRPIVSSDTLEIKRELDRYIDQTKQLYYKLFVDLNNDNQWEFITGYADIEAVELLNSTTAKIRLKNIDYKIGKDPEKKDHPFALAAWNYVQSTRQELMNDNPKGPLEERPRTDSEIMKIFATALSAINPLTTLSKFRDFYKSARKAGWGTKVDYDKSFIRLNSFVSLLENDVIEKFGGDSRVRSIIVYEGKDTSHVIAGQYYDYTDSLPGTNLKMSTGIAANEPTIGGDESALRYGKIGFLDPGFKTKYLQFQEMPLNESYMPAPDVGYSKVTVKSYATEKVLAGQLPVSVPTTGVSVHEFYTAKDFPTIFRETELSQPKGTLIFMKPNLAFRPLGGTKTISNFAGTQGYYTEINDMHGKEKKISYYGMSHSGKVISTPISYVEYLYKSKPATDNLQNPIRILENEVPTIKNHLGVVENKLVGVDIENFIDTRQSHSYTYSNGGRHNLSVMMFTFPLPLYTYFPDNSSDQRRSYTCVNNKITHKFGILEQTKVYKEGALTTTDNLVYDAYTGTPILTSVNNEFNDTIYNYNVPAHLIYGNMQPSYPTNDFAFTGTVVDYERESNQLIINLSLPMASQDLRQYLNEGDEILIKEESQEDGEDIYERCFIMQVDNDKKIIKVKGNDGFAPGVVGDIEMYIYRPYYRNQLQESAGTIVSRHNPLATASIQGECD